jgi:signal transduction histidine kinase
VATTDHRPPTTDHRRDTETRRHGEVAVGDLPVSLSPGLRVLPSSVVGRQSSVVFSVSDTGQGIAPDDLPHVFDRFYRADRSRTRGSGGAGLGLAIAKQIVVAHSGAIWAESEVGKGTTINVALPVADANTSAPAIDEPQRHTLVE